MIGIGLRPKCHRQGINYHEDCNDHWSVCKTHKLKWWTGSGLFSFPFTDDEGEFSWENGEKLLKHNRFVLAGCRTVKPFYWPREFLFKRCSAMNGTRRQ